MKGRLRTSVAALVLSLLAACARQEPERPPNVVFLTIDTLRHDRLSCYGYPRPTSPHLDRFARDALTFEKVYTQGAWTLASYATLLTSRYPSRHGAVWPRNKVSEEEVSLAEVFRDAGYQSLAVVNNTLLGPARNLSQGFDEYDFDNSRPREIRSAAESAERIVAWLEERDRSPFFLLINLMEPHTDYCPTPPLERRFDPGYEGEFREAFPDFKIPLEYLFPPEGEIDPALTGEVREHARALYDSEVLEADLGIGPLFDALRRLDLWDATIVAVFSDHGEELWDHRGFGHGHVVYEEMVRVPLVLRVPRSSPGVRGLARTGIETAAIGLIDVAPTILDLAGIPIPPTFQGVSFAQRTGPDAAARGGLLTEATLYGGELKSYVEGDWKLVFDVFLGRRSLYDLRQDPAERHDLAGEQPERADDLLRKLAEITHLSAGGWRVACTGDDGPTVFRGRMETSGTITQALPHRLEAFQNTRRERDRVRDEWRIEDDGHAIDFTFRVDSDVDGLTLVIEPPDAPASWSVTRDGAADPSFVRLGRSSESPERVPFTVSPDAVSCPALLPPQGWREAGAGTFAIWTVAGDVAARAEEVELDGEALENLRALGYVD